MHSFLYFAAITRKSLANRWQPYEMRKDDPNLDVTKKYKKTPDFRRNVI